MGVELVNSLSLALHDLRAGHGFRDCDGLELGGGVRVWDAEHVNLQTETLGC